LKNYNKMNIKIALLSGDGIGPEIIDQAVKVVKAIALFSRFICISEA